jgi:two-component system response regulator AtoC
VRELENVLTQAMVIARDGQITESHIRFKQSPGPAVDPAPPPSAPDPHLQSLEEVEAAHIQQVLQHTRGHKGNSCEILGISRPALDRKIQKYDLKLPERD